MPATSSVPPVITSRFDDALAYARQLHADQPQKGTAIPYLVHLLDELGRVVAKLK